MTKSETVLWKNIKGNQLGYKFRRQHGIGDFIIDFYCPALRLAVEVDGLTHSDITVYEKDIVKQKYLENLGIIVKRYSAEQIFKTINQVLKDIYQTCDKLKSENIYVRPRNSTDPSCTSPS